MLYTESCSSPIPIHGIESLPNPKPLRRWHVMEVSVLKVGELDPSKLSPCEMSVTPNKAMFSNRRPSNIWRQCLAPLVFNELHQDRMSSEQFLLSEVWGFLSCISRSSLWRLLVLFSLSQCLMASIMFDITVAAFMWFLHQSHLLSLAKTIAFVPDPDELRLASPLLFDNLVLWHLCR